VFLALAVGVVMGSTFIAGSELDLLKSRQDDLKRQIDDARETNRVLTRENNAFAKFQEEAEDTLLAGDLAGVPVVVVAVRGIDQAPAEAVRKQLANTGAASQGTIWLTRKLRLDNQADVESLVGTLALTASDKSGIREQAIGVLADALRGAASGATQLEALRVAGFIEIEAPAAATVTTTTLLPATVPTAPRVVVVSGAGAEMSDEEVAIPLVRALAASSAGAIAAEAGNDEPGGREVFVGPLRRDAELAPGVSTIDDLESFAGRAALVALLRMPANSPAGHFGVGPQAEREVPAAAPES
jgi:hypothetical protein